MTSGMTSRGSMLAGIRVLDLSAYIAGPYACALLADMGADLIKVEPPGGDTLRSYPSTLEAESRAFLGVNRSKRGIAIDLKKPAGQAVFKRLVQSCDVLVHNFRPAVPERLGIDYASLKVVNPKLVYCALTGYGQDGPLADRAGYDQVLQAMTGICSFQGQGKAGPEIVYGSVVDFFAASMLSNAVCAALYHRAMTGEGQSLGLSLLGAALAMQATRMVWADNEPREVGRDMRSGGITGIHPCAEGTHIYVSANTPHFWVALCKVLGMPEFAANSEYDTVKKRAANAQVLVPAIRAALKKRRAPEWEKLFGDQVPSGAVRAIEDTFDAPQVLHEELVTHFDHPAVGGYRAFAGAFRFDAAERPQPFAAPTLGQHTDEILAEHGYEPSEIARLHSDGVV